MQKKDKHYQIDVSVEVKYLPEESEPSKRSYIFAYTITLFNSGNVPAKLMTRHWYIIDGYGRVQEVKGEGVVGEHPYLRPGESYQYTSFSMVETPLGSMHGSYHMLADDGQEFEATIPMFRLEAVTTLH